MKEKIPKCGKWLTDRYEPKVDIRNVIPEVEDTIKITGNIGKIITEEQWKCLIEQNRVAQYGSNGLVSYVILEAIFDINDIKNKIKELCDK